MKKILFFSLVDWRWIKQRPHHISQGLAKYCQVRYVCKKNLKKNSKVKQSNNIRNLLIYRFWAIPFALYKHSIIHYINSILFKFYFMIYRLNGFENIIITHPVQFDWIPRKLLKSANIIYDCMDSYQDFENSHVINKIIIENEKKIVKYSDSIIVSSEELKQRLIHKYSDKICEKIYVINNGVDLETFSKNYIKQHLHEFDNDLDLVKLRKFKSKTVGYIGTISNWMDWEVIYEAAVKFDHVYFWFIGPIEQEIPSKIKNLKNIIFTGAKDYYSIPLYIDQFDVVIYPFKLNDLILAVNPVKIYEYLALEKRVLSVRYKETEKFSKYINLYSDQHEFIQELDNILNNSSNIVDSRSFILNEGWEQRSKQFYDIIKLK